MGQGGRLASGFRGIGGRFAPVDAVDRQFHHPGSPACHRRKGAPDHAIDRSRGGLTSKIHVVLDESGLPVRLAPAAGQASDKVRRPRCLNSRPPPASSLPVVAITGSTWSIWLPDGTGKPRSPPSATARSSDRSTQQPSAARVYGSTGLADPGTSLPIAGSCRRQPPAAGTCSAAGFRSRGCGLEFPHPAPRSQFCASRSVMRRTATRRFCRSGPSVDTSRNCSP